MLAGGGTPCRSGGVKWLVGLAGPPWVALWWLG